MNEHNEHRDRLDCELERIQRIPVRNRSDLEYLKQRIAELEEEKARLK